MASRTAPEGPRTHKLGSSTAAERRKIRNRLSQQAFRARQSSELNELRAQLRQFSGSESARNNALREENRRLRRRLELCQIRLRSHQETLSQIVNSLDEQGEAVDGEGYDGEAESGMSPEFVGNSGIGSVSGSPSLDQNLMSGTTTSLSSSSLLPLDLSIEGQSQARDTGYPPGAYQVYHTGSGRCVELFDDLDQTQPSSTSLESETGHLQDEKATTTKTRQMWPSQPIDLNTTNAHALESEDNGLNSSGRLDEGFHTSTKTSLLKHGSPQGRTSVALLRSLKPTATSKYSDHINAYEFCVVTRYLNDQISLDCNSLVDVISSMVTTFSDLYWHSMRPWIHHTNGTAAISKLTAWRLAPSTQTYNAVPTYFRPTQLQTAVPHPAVIDWCVFPFLRDKLIQYHSSDPNLDNICGDIGEAYVVQADLSELVVDAGPLLVNFSVLDIIHGLECNSAWFDDENSATVVDDDGDDTDEAGLVAHSHSHLGLEAPLQNITHPKSLPAPSLHALLHSREYVRALYEFLDIRGGVERFYIDKSLFVKYPHLYEPSPYIGCGVPLRSANHVKWDHPLPLDSIAMSCYQSTGLASR